MRLDISETCELAILAVCLMMVSRIGLFVRDVAWLGRVSDTPEADIF